MGQSRLGKKQKRLLPILQVTIFGAFAYSVFLPLQLGTAWFYAGFTIYLVGMIFFTLATLIFTASPKGEVVTKGVYRISRNPMDFGWSLVFIGTGLACASWVFVLCAVVFMVIMQRLVVFEEAMCLGEFGRAYREYMDRTPRWIGIPKSREK